MSKGITYEKKINQILKVKQVQLVSTQSAGASDAPDGFFWNIGTRYPLEIKGIGADFTQIELRWTKERGFFYSEKSKNADFRDFLLNNKPEFLERINNEWTKTPRKFNVENPTKEDRLWDVHNFKDIKDPVDVLFVECFYNLKNPPVNYMQIENRGFFYMDEDIAGLGVPRINGKPYLRARVKTRNKILWGFLVAIKMPYIEKSNYDIEEKVGDFPFSEGDHIRNSQTRLNNYF